MRYTRSAFERQLLESVLIEGNRHHHILNARSEYNRCAIPRLATKMGEKDIEKWKKDEIEMQTKEENLESKIRNMKKERNRLRMQNQRQLPPAKRQRTDVGPVPVPVERLRVVEINIPTKRKGIAREDGGTQKRKRLGNDIRTYMTQENDDSYMVKSIMAAGAECSESTEQIVSRLLAVYQGILKMGRLVAVVAVIW